MVRKRIDVVAYTAGILEFGNYVAAKKGGLTKAMSKQRSRIALKLRKLNQKYGKGVVSQKSFADVL